MTTQLPGIKVLFISGYTGDAIVHHGILDPNADFLQKPFSAEALCTKVRLILDSKRKIQHILVVDDDPAIRALLATILEESGFRVVTAGEGGEALTAVSEYPFDLVITDLVMPDHEGIELIRRLKKRYAHLKIIAISGAFGSEILDAARMLGADATLAKPLSANALLLCIDSLSGSPS
jgi:DNA-binding response OmpR family regulator